MTQRKALADIVVRDRFRRDLGELDSLARSIESRGLINPVTVNENNVLLAGFRRLSAVRSLGWTEIDVHVVRTLDDAAASIRIERDENTQRKDMTNPELSNLAAALADLETASARERQTGGLVQNSSSDRSAGTGGTVKGAGDSKKIIGDALGIGSTNANDLIQIGRAARSADPAQRSAGLAAQARLNETSIERAASEMRDELGRKRTTSSGRNRVSPANGRDYPRKADLIRPADQMSALSGQANYCRGLVGWANLILERMPAGLSGDIDREEVGRLMADFSAARVALTKVINLLKGNINP